MYVEIGQSRRLEQFGLEGMDLKSYIWNQNRGRIISNYKPDFMGTHGYNVIAILIVTNGAPDLME